MQKSSSWPERGSPVQSRSRFPSGSSNRFPCSSKIFMFRGPEPSSCSNRNRILDLLLDQNEDIPFDRKWGLLLRPDESILINQLCIAATGFKSIDSQGQGYPWKPIAAQLGRGRPHREGHRRRREAWGCPRGLRGGRPHREGHSRSRGARGSGGGG